jgi:mRNA-degrading endonuclease toxin of MazEF toxin-antitoxin module
MPILTRQEVIGLLHTVIVAPITSSVRGAPSEVVIGIDEGPKQNQQLNLIMCKP